MDWLGKFKIFPPDEQKWPASDHCKEADECEEDRPIQADFRLSLFLQCD